MVSPSTRRHRRALHRKALRLIRERHGEFDLSRYDIAEALGVSERQVVRVFQEVGAEPFRDALLRIRMERARRLLGRRRFMSVREVARAVGYREASGLRQAFIRYWGTNPSAVRPAHDLDEQYDEEWRAAESRATNAR